MIFIVLHFNLEHCWTFCDRPVQRSNLDVAVSLYFSVFQTLIFIHSFWSNCFSYIEGVYLCKTWKELKVFSKTAPKPKLHMGGSHAQMIPKKSCDIRSLSSFNLCDKNLLWYSSITYNRRETTKNSTWIRCKWYDEYSPRNAKE